MYRNQIAVSFEADLIIISPGIATRFLKWFEDMENNDDIYNETFECPPDYSHSHLSVQDMRVFCVGMWEFGIESRHQPVAERDNYIWLHIYPNVPMQMLHEYLPELLKGLGVEEFELRYPRYLEEVKKNVDFLLSNAVKEQDAEN